MYNFYKRYRLVFLVLAFSVASFVFNAAKADTPIPFKERIADTAGVLKPEEKEQLTELSAKLEKETGAVLVAVLVKHLQDETIEDFATRLHDKWKPGLDNDGRGAILIIATADRKLRIAPTRSMGVTYTDSRASRVVDSLKPYLKKMEYANAVSTYLVQSAAFAGKAEPSVAPVVAQPQTSSGLPSIVWILIIGFVFLVALSMLMSHIRRERENALREIELREARERQRELERQQLKKQRLHRLEMQQKFDAAPERPGYRKYIDGDRIAYVFVEKPFTSQQENEMRQAQRNANIRKDVNLEKLTIATSASALAVSAAALETQNQEKREREAREARARSVAEEERKRKKRREEEEEDRRRRQRDDSFTSSFSSGGGSYSSSSSSDFSSSSSSSSDGGGSSGDY